MGLFDSISRARSAQTAAEVTAAVAEIEAERIDAAEQLAAANERRGELLFDGNSAELAKLEADISTLVQTLDRIDAVLPRLRDKALQLEAEEAEKYRDSLYQAAVRVQAVGVEALRRYDDLAPELTKQVAIVDACRQKIADINQQLGQLKYGKTVEHPEAVTCTRGQWSPLPQSTRLPSITGVGLGYWPPANSSAELIGPALTHAESVVRKAMEAK